MKNTKKVGIIIVIVLAIIFAVSVLSGQKNNSTVKKIDCQTACHQIGNNNWIFPGAGPISENIYSAKEDCISACQAKIKK